MAGAGGGRLVIWSVLGGSWSVVCGWSVSGGFVLRRLQIP